jgi:predicted ATPase
VRLFAERAAAVDGRFAVTDASLPAVLEICRALDGLPLAIELAAASAPLIGLEPLRCARPADRLALLEDRWRAGAPRLPLRRSLERSCRLLTPPQRAMLTRLGRFERSFTLAEAQGANDGLERAEAARAVAALVHRSLLQVSADPAQPRYRMLQVVRTVALEDASEERPLPWGADRGEAAGRGRWASDLGAFAD